VLHYGKDGALAGPGKEQTEPSMLSLHLFQASIVRVSTLLLQQVRACVSRGSARTGCPTAGVTVEVSCRRGTGW
jgi:hypothetical protein